MLLLGSSIVVRLPAVPVSLEVASLITFVSHLALPRLGLDNGRMNNDTLKRRWCQFSLRMLLIVMTVATLVFGGWIQYRRLRAQENRDRIAAVEKAVTAIQELGGLVESEYEVRRPINWLEELFDDPGGLDGPAGGWRVSRVGLQGSKVTDAGLEHLKVLTDLRELWLGGPNVSDDGLEHLGRAAERP